MTQSMLAKSVPKPLPAERGKALLDDWARSGLSKIAYARQHQIGVHRLSYWNKRLKEISVSPARAVRSAATTDFIEIPLADQQSFVTPPVSAPAPIEILFPRGIALRIRSGVDVSLLRTVISVLGQSPC